MNLRPSSRTPLKFEVHIVAVAYFYADGADGTVIDALKLKQATKEVAPSLLLLTGLCCFVSAAGFVFGCLLAAGGTSRSREQSNYWC